MKRGHKARASFGGVLYIVGEARALKPSEQALELHATAHYIEPHREDPSNVELCRAPCARLIVRSGGEDKSID